MDIKFNSLQELYERVKPALTTKREEMKRLGICKRRRYMELL